jgi:PleD family two-component response regulator
VILVPPAANAADATLYQGKERGRDQVAVFQAPDA